MFGIDMFDILATVVAIGIVLAGLFVSLGGDDEAEQKLDSSWEPRA